MAKRASAREKKETASKKEEISPGRIHAAIRGWVLKDLARVELRRATEDGRSERVSSWDIGEEKNADALAFKITTLAREEADSYGGRNRFTLRVYDGADPNHADQRTFVVNAESEVIDDDAPSEGPTPRGVTSQSMRHLENAARTQASASADIHTAYRDIIGMLKNHVHSQDETISKMREREADMYEMRERLITEEHMRVLQMNQEARKDQIVSKGLEMFTRYAPVLVGSFARGGNKGPLPPIVGEEHVKNLLISVTNNPEKLAAVAAALGPADMATLAQLASAYQAKEETETKKLPPGSSTNGAAS